MRPLSVVLSLVFACSIPAYSSSLSRSIEFDRLLMHAHNSVVRGDYRSAAADYGHAAKLDMGAPESFYLDYGATLGALGRWKDAKAVLETYFRRFDKQGEFYDLALKRYVEAGDRVSTHSEERVRPQLVGMADAAPVTPPVRRTSSAASWAKTNPPAQAQGQASYGPAYGAPAYPQSQAAPAAAATSLPPMPVTQAAPAVQAQPVMQAAAYATPTYPAPPAYQAPERRQAPVAQPVAADPAYDAPAPNNRAMLEGMIGLYSGEAKDSDDTSRGASCTKASNPAKPHPASDCFYGFHRSMSLNVVDGSAVVGFVKVEYVREHRPALTADQHAQKAPIRTKMEYYLAIRLWLTSGGLIQGQQKGLCEFLVDEKTCSQSQPRGLTPLRARLTEDGGLGLESEKGGGLRIYTKIRAVPDMVRAEVVHVVPSLSPYVDEIQPQQPRPAEVQAKPASLGDTAERGSDDDDDSVAAGVATAAREIFKARVVG